MIKTYHKTYLIKAISALPLKLHHHVYDFNWFNWWEAKTVLLTQIPGNCIFISFSFLWWAKNVFKKQHVPRWSSVRINNGQHKEMLRSGFVTKSHQNSENNHQQSKSSREVIFYWKAENKTEQSDSSCIYEKASERLDSNRIESRNLLDTLAASHK